MYFFDLKGLVESMKSDEKFFKSSYTYLIAAIILSTLLGAVNIESSEGWSLENFVGELIGAIVVSIIFFVAISYFNRLNGGDDGKNFLDKLICLNWVVGCRVLAGAGPLLLLFAILTYKVHAFFALFLLVVFVGMIVYIIKTIGHSLTQIREHELAMKAESGKIEEN